MIKKVLVGIFLVIFSVLTIIFGWVSALYSESDKYISELTKKEEYHEIFNSVFSGTVTTNEPVVIKDGEMVIHMYKTISTFSKEVKGQNVVDKITQGVEILMFNIPKDIDLGDITKVSGNGYTGRIDVPVYTEYVYDAYNIFSVTVDTTDYDLDNRLTKISLETEEETVYSLDVDISSLLFSAEDESNWNEYINRFNAHVQNTVHSTEDKTDEEIEEINKEQVYLTEKLTELLEDTDFVMTTFDSSIITARTGFVVRTTVTTICVILANVVIVYFLFLRGKIKPFFQSFRNKGSKEISNNTNSNK